MIETQFFESKHNLSKVTSVFFVGDVASIDDYTEKHHHTSLAKQLVVLNFEGGLAREEELNSYRKTKSVFNSVNLLNSLFRDSYLLFNLANNHIDDVGTINRTKRAIEEKGHITIGAGDNLSEASQVKHCLIGETDYIFMSFGWDVIECNKARRNRSGVNPLNASWVLSEFAKEKKQFPNSKFVVLMHWCYELEVIPLPYHRTLAHSLVDLGCDFIIGCHPHCVQPIERYKHGVIVYSLGNWFFKESYFFSGKLRFPDYCSLQIMFEITHDLEFIVHLYEKRNCKTLYIGKYSVEELNKLIGFGEFEEITDQKYDAYFKKNRVKTKFLPIYRTKESRNSLFFKDIFNFFRTSLINLLVKIGVK
ncbi:poly-gamma-glutamate synthesis protein (capsule biosynthesis protein) [Pseudidiomarina maritima]|uniref:Poly-gamma-glutamate synthesis protein (Capsule biosynthesis protein) n=1 Tax=Pseudidiomarina maritima TaxID=519453 RepID=A0A1I6GRX7_9GAMM|nr:CapA family protein [Pseudidiomarina maritima]SFR44869.1 poly-gamma-glutamate synthesis protein (capsule biosynthesis protein) [Pseudidiomarina maritima]